MVKDSKSTQSFHHSGQLRTLKAPKLCVPLFLNENFKLKSSPKIFQEYRYAAPMKTMRLCQVVIFIFNRINNISFMERSKVAFPKVCNIPPPPLLSVLPLLKVSGSIGFRYLTHIIMSKFHLTSTISYFSLGKFSLQETNI